MDLQNLANEYAKNRLSMIIEKTIKDIFSDGFKAGYQAKSDEIDEVEILKIAEAKAEVARAEAEREAAERAESLRIAKEKAERDRIEKERQEEERLAFEKAEREKAERERKEKEALEEQRIAAEKAAKEKAAKEAAAKKKANNDRKDEQLKDMKFVDLDLPSGILWPKSISDEKLSYRKAIKKYHLPTFEQWNELLEECKIEYDHSSFMIRSANGKEIIFSGNFKNESNSSSRTSVSSKILQFWLDDEEDSKHEVRCVEIRYTITQYYDRDGFLKSTSENLSHNVIRVFAGDALPVIPVKYKV